MKLFVTYEQRENVRIDLNLVPVFTSAANSSLVLYVFELQEIAFYSHSNFALALLDSKIF